MFRKLLHKEIYILWNDDATISGGFGPEQVKYHYIGLTKPKKGDLFYTVAVSRSRAPSSFAESLGALILAEAGERRSVGVHYCVGELPDFLADATYEPHPAGVLRERRFRPIRIEDQVAIQPLVLDFLRRYYPKA